VSVNLSQAANQAVWGLIEQLDTEGRYATGAHVAPMVERLAKMLIRELPSDLGGRASRPGPVTDLPCSGFADYAAVPCEDPEHYRGGEHV
jgi:hypothetical protein